MGKAFGEFMMLTYYLLDAQGIFDEGNLIKINSEALAEEIKSLAQNAARRIDSEDVAVIFFHTSACSANQMAECMTYWQKLVRDVWS